MPNPTYGSPTSRYAGGNLAGANIPYGAAADMGGLASYGDTFTPLISKYPALYGGLNYGSPIGAGGAWGSAPLNPPGAGAIPRGAGGVPGTAGAQLVQTDKFPAATAGLNAALGRVGTDGNSLVSSIRDPAQAGRIAAAGSSLTASTGQQDATLHDYVNNFLSGENQRNAVTQGDVGAIGNVYGPAGDPNSMQGSLNKLAGQRWQAIQGSLGRALGAAQGNSNLARLGMGGNSSYANAQLADAAGNIMANAAGGQADLNRSNYLATLQAQLGSAGQRGNLLFQNLAQNINPVQAALQTQSGQLSNLATLGGIRNANTVDRTQQQLTAEQLANYNAAIQGLNNSNISGLQAPYQLPNMGPIPRNLPGPGPGSTGGYGTPPGVTLDASTGAVVPPPASGNPSDINPATGQSWMIPPSQLANYMSGRGPYSQPQYYSNAGSGTGDFGSGPMQYIPGVGMVPAAGFFPQPADYYGNPGGDPQVTVDTGGIG